MPAKPKSKSKQRRRTAAEKATAVASVVVDGKVAAQVAAEVGVSQRTVEYWLRAYREGRLELSDFLREYRARAVGDWLEIVRRATSRVESTIDEATAKDSAQVAKIYSEMTRHAAGEPDVTVESTDSAALARDRLRLVVNAKRESGGGD